MNILQIYNKIPIPPKDGGSIAVYGLSECFVKLGHSVHLAALNTNKHYVNIDSLQDLIPKNLKIFYFDINTNIKPLRVLFNLLFSSLPYNAERFLSEGFNNILFDLLNKYEYDIIQIEGLYMLQYIQTIRNYSNAKISYRAHNVENEIWLNTLESEKNPIKRYYLKKLYNRIYKLEKDYINTYDLLVPITEKDAEYFKKEGNDKLVHTSPTGLDFSKYRCTDKKLDKFKFFHLGSLDWIPNQEGLLWFLNNIWPEIATKYKNATFTIAGRNAPDSFVEKITKYQNVIFNGEVDNAIEFMHDHTIMIVPLFSGSGMRIKIIEGLASGSIIITTSKGVEGIPAQNRKHLFIVNTVSDFLECIDQIVSDNFDLKEISNNAQQFISNNFDNFAVSKSLLEFYEEAITRK